MCAQCDFSKHSGIFTLGNSHPLIVTLYSLWRSMMVLKKKKKKKGEGEGEGEEGEGEGEGGEQEITLYVSLPVSFINYLRLLMFRQG